MRRLFLVLPFVLAGLLSIGIFVRLQNDIALEKLAYREARLDEAHFNTRVIQDPIRHIYESLRTIARLPGVRNVDRHAVKLDVNARATVQELYNTLYANLALSEIYLVPADLDPDAIDSGTGLPQTPIITFDQYIVGRTALGKGGHEAGAQEVPEVEIFEYRLMKQQMTWFKEHVPTVSAIRELDYPMLTGPEVITCDNTYYSPATPDDKDRSGLVFSVPFFGPDDSLHGCVSCIVLTRVLRDLLPGPQYVLLQPRYNYLVTPASPGQWSASMPAILRHEADSGLIFSAVIPLDLKTSDGEWALWAGVPDLEFWASPKVIAVQRLAILAVVVLWGLAVVGAILYATISQRREKLRLARHNQDLQQEVERRKLVERDLIKARKEAEAATAAKSEFLANMSHEIRTPMNGVLGMTRLLKMSNLSPHQMRYCEAIQTSADSLLGVINDILDFSRIEAGKLEVEAVPFDLAESVEDVMDLIGIEAERKHIEFACLVSPDVPRQLRGDYFRLRQILMNICGNAVKFTDAGSVVLRIAIDSLTERQAVVRFEVTDSGPGIPEEKRDQLFKSFSQLDGSTTREFGGTGLGLAIARQLVHLMGGDIDVHSELGKGSVFWFTLPLELQASHGFTAPERTDAAGVRVLLVDDSAPGREILREHFAPMQCTVEMASSGAIALAMLRAAHANGTPYAMAVIDEQMPGMDGVELALQIRLDGRFEDLALIMVASLISPIDPEYMLRLGISGSITKPIKQSRLLDAVVCALGKEQAKSLAVPAAEGLLDRFISIQSPLRGSKILVVEDNQINAELIEVMLQKLWCESRWVKNGSEAVRAVAQEKPALVLMDCQMPVMDGFDATRAIRAAEGGGPHLPILALTANAMRGDRERCLEAGMDDYLSKPVQIETLAHILEKWLAMDTPLPETAPFEAVAPTGALRPSGQTGTFDMQDLCDNCMGDADLAQRLLAVFHEQVDVFTQAMDRACREGDWDTLGRETHKLKGSAGAICARTLAAAANSVEMHVRAGTLMENMHEIAAMNEALQAVKSEIVTLGFNNADEVS